MAGTDSRFNAAKVRKNIKFAMSMGAPEDTEERITFRWLPDKQYTNTDSGGNPYSWTTPPNAQQTRPDQQVDASWEFVSRVSAERDTILGRFTPSRVVVTLLDEDYDKVFDDEDNPPNLMVINDIDYEISFVAPPQGLFEVTVYEIYGQAIDNAVRGFD